MATEQTTTDSAENPVAAGGADDQLVQEFASRGLTLTPATDPLPTFDGSLSAVGFAPPGDDGPARIAAAVIAGDDLEAFDLAVAAIQAANLDLTPATAVSIESLDELTATLNQPQELLTVQADGSPIGVVVRHADRRKDVDDAGSASASSTARGAGAAMAPSAGGAGVAAGLGLLQDVVLEVSVELGRPALPLAQLMNLGIGSVVELDRSAGAPVDVRVNGTLFAKGEVVVVDDEYAVRIIEILPPQAH
jgi:flagellar motor switch protein FliN/FliY